MDKLESQLKKNYSPNDFQKIQIYGPYSSIEVLFDNPGVPEVILWDASNEQIGGIVEKILPEYEHKMSEEMNYNTKILRHSFEGSKSIIVGYDFGKIRLSIRSKGFDFKMTDSERTRYVDLVNNIEEYVKSLGANILFMHQHKVA